MSECCATCSGASSPILFIVLGRLGASPWEIVGQRTVWSAPCALACVLAAGQGGVLRRVFARPRVVGLLALSAAAIATGWALFVWAVNHGRNLEASLGYYINPLMNMAAGALLFRERIGRLGLAAIALAAVGVVLQTCGARPPAGGGPDPRHHLLDLRSDPPPGGCGRPAGPCGRVPVDVRPGPRFSSLAARPRRLALRATRLDLTRLMLLLGPVTVAPLALFSWTARRLPFSAMGFIQFISPTIGFATGLVLGEPLSPLSALSFVFIWAGAAVVRLRRLARGAAPSERGVGGRDQPPRPAGRRRGGRTGGSSHRRRRGDARDRRRRSCRPSRRGRPSRGSAPRRQAARCAAGRRPRRGRTAAPGRGPAMRCARGFGRRRRARRIRASPMRPSQAKAAMIRARAAAVAYAADRGDGGARSAASPRRRQATTRVRGRPGGGFRDGAEVRHRRRPAHLGEAVCLAIRQADPQVEAERLGDILRAGRRPASRPSTRRKISPAR